MMSEYFHLSKIKNLKSIKPSIPKVGIDLPGLECSEIPRACFSSSIGGAVISIQLTDSAFDKKDYIDVYVYSPKYEVVPNYTNADLKLEGLVFDSHLTGEVWFLSKIEVKNVGYVRIFKDPAKEIRYRPDISDGLLRDLIIKRIANADGTLTTYNREWKFYPKNKRI